MNKFEEPIIQIEKFDLLDVITTSGSCDFDCSDDGFACPNVTAGN